MGVSDRMFLAVDLDDETRHALGTHVESSLDGGLLPGRPVPLQNWHITLRFLGPTEDTQRDKVLAHLDQHLVVEPFRIRFTGLGGFPRQARASVLWMGLEGDVTELEKAAAICETAAEEAGFEPEGRPFHPHVTLSRIRPPVDIRPLVDQVEPAGVVSNVRAVTLFRSILGRGAARYEVVEKVEL
jgi:2'-5' RNA ligase